MSDDSGPRVRRPRLQVITALVVLTAAVGIIATRPLGVLTGQSASPLPTGSRAPGIGIGQLAPDFVRASDGAPLLTDVDGRPIRLANFAGRPLWIVFWATWCVPCQEEASDIMALYDAHRADGLRVLAIDVQEPTSAVREFIAQHGIDYDVVLDDSGEARSLYGGWGLPMHFFLDAHGVIRDRAIGQLTRTSMASRLRSILGG
jgi:cytochrome c biogenesis protein CcmG/thiol:disulfide interchange protein DsbE